jgi:multidrug efflux pump subunit AcrA (membrane-fusion protein)
MKKIVFLSIICLPVLLGACSSSQGEMNAQPISATQRLPVVVKSIHRQDVAQKIMSKGTFQAKERAVLSPRISGHIKSITFEEGDTVTKGQLLVQMDNTQQRLELMRAEATLKELKARLEMTRTEVESARSRILATQAALIRYESDRNLKALEKERMERLWQNQTIPQQKYDTAKSAFDMAVASVKASQAELESARAGLKAARARLKTAEASLAGEEKSLEICKQHLEDTKITAPIDGVITQKLKNAGEMSDPGKPILILEKTDLLELRARVSSIHLKQIRPGAPVTIYPDGLAEPLKAEISRINPTIDPLDRSMEIICEVKNPDYTLKPGLFAKIEIISQILYQAVVVPGNSIVERDNQSVVFVVDGEKAKMVPVVPGYEEQEKRVIRQGLKGGEMVIIEGQGDLCGQELIRIERRG